MYTRSDNAVELSCRHRRKAVPVTAPMGTVAEDELGTKVKMQERPQFRDVEDFCNRTAEWVSDERDEEVAEINGLLQELTPSELQERGLALLRLLVSDISSGLYGRVIVKLVPKGADRKNKDGSSSESEKTNERRNRQPLSSRLPSHKFTSGDIVGMFDMGHPFHLPPICTGVVHQVRSDAIWIAFEDAAEGTDGDPAESGQRSGASSSGLSSWCDNVVHMALVSSEVTTRRQLAVLNRLQDISGHE